MRRLTRLALVAVLAVSLVAVASTGAAVAHEDAEYATYADAEADATGDQIPKNVCDDPDGIVDRWSKTLGFTDCWTLVEPDYHESGLTVGNFVESANTTLEQQAIDWHAEGEMLEGYLWSVGFAEYVESLEEGNEQFEARADAQEAIQEEGQARIHSAVGWNNDHVRDVYEQAVSVENVDEAELQIAYEDTQYGGTDYHYYDSEDDGIETMNRTFFQEEYTIECLAYCGTRRGYDPLSGDNTNDREAGDIGLRFRDNSDEDDFGGGYTFRAWESHERNIYSSFEGIVDAIQEAQDNVDEFDEHFDADEHNVSDIDLDPQTYVQEYGEEDGSGQYAAATLAMSGIDVGASDEVLVDYAGDEYTGLLGLSADLSDDANETMPLEEGDTLDLSNKSGHAVLIETDTGNEHRFDNSVLEILEIYGDRDGLEYESTEFDTTDSQQTLDEFMNYMETVENASKWEDSGDDSGVAIDLGDSDLPLLWIGLGLVVVLLLGVLAVATSGKKQHSGHSSMYRGDN